MLVLGAAASAFGAEPAARPLNVTRPIFALPAASPSGSTGSARGAATMPQRPMPHRQLLEFVPQKSVAAPASADAKNPAPPPRFGISTTPHHRRTLGW